jgi:hypothetical protein
LGVSDRFLNFWVATKKKKKKWSLGVFLVVVLGTGPWAFLIFWFLNLVPWAFPDVFEFSWQFSLGRFF